SLVCSTLVAADAGRLSPADRADALEFRPAPARSAPARSTDRPARFPAPAARLDAPAPPLPGIGVAAAGPGDGRAAVGPRLGPVGCPGTRCDGRGRLQPEHAGRDAHATGTSPDGPAGSGAGDPEARWGSPGPGRLCQQAQVALPADARLRPFPLRP